jgi:transposase-like protein
MSTSVEAIAGEKATRRYRTQAERRQIVEQTLSAGVSVATVARAHGVNANQLFHWRKLYHAGLLEQAPGAAASNDLRLLPVVVHDEPAHGGGARGRNRGPGRGRLRRARHLIALKKGQID